MGFHICVINDMNTRKHTLQLITGENFYTATEKIKRSDTVGVCLCTCRWKLGGGGSTGFKCNRESSFNMTRGGGRGGGGGGGGGAGVSSDKCITNHIFNVHSIHFSSVIVKMNFSL